MQRKEFPPGPSTLSSIGSPFRLAHDPLGFLTRIAEKYGSIARINLYGFNIYLLTSPEAIGEVLVTQQDRFIMDLFSRRLRDYIGNNLLISDGPLWEQQRRRVSGAFSATRIAAYRVTIADIVEEGADAWRGVQPDVFRRMGTLVLTLLARTALGVGQTADLATVHDAVNVLANHVMGIRGTGVRLPYALPTPGNLAARKALQQISTALSAATGQPASALDAGPSDVPTVLNLLRNAQPPGIAAEQVKNELVTMLLVGHETTALALTFACWLLATHPQIQDEVADGLRAADFLHGASTGPPATRLLDAIAHEALRLYPPVPAFGREATSPVTIAGYELRPRSQVIVSPWVMHRKAEWFPEPDRFEPRRWLEQHATALPRYTYLPFGGGTRRCLGSNLAHAEITIVLAVLLKRYRLRSVDGQHMEVYASVTLRPRDRVCIEFIERR